MSKILIVVFLTVYTSSFAQPKQSIFGEFYSIDKDHSYIGFSIKYMGWAKVRGRFADFSGLVRYDPGELSKTSTTISISASSINTDLDFRDNDLKSENWFDVVKYPRILFQSQHLNKTP